MEDYAYLKDNFYKLYNKNTTTNPSIGLYFSKVPVGSSYDLPKASMLIRFNRELTVLEKESLINGLRTKFNSDKTIIFDVPSLIATINDGIGYLTLFSISVVLIAIILSFFLILISFIANIKENSWEFGVLRAIGLNKDQITRCYVYEALSIIVVSGLLGTIVGIIIAVTL